MTKSSVFRPPRWAIVPALVLLVVVSACAGTALETPATPDANVTGTVTYLQRSALAPGSVVTVQVQDVSRMDAPAVILGGAGHHDHR